MAAATTLLTFLSTGSPTGLKFTVEHGESRLLFDFGLEHAPGRMPFSMGLQPRPGRELADLQALGVAPRLSGVYDAWDGRTSVFLSHLHLDHTSLVRFLHPDAPLYFPAAMEPLREATVRSGYLAWRPGSPGTPVADRGLVRVGELEVELVAVDHDLPGATGFLVRTPDYSLAYTGDHRWHGLHPELTEGFGKTVRGVDVLIQEGVMLGQDPAEPRPTEAAVLEGFERLLERAGGLVVVNLYPMNRERVAAFARACSERGRRFLMEPVSAAIADWPDVLDDLEAVRRNPEGHCLQLTFEQLPLLIDLQPPPGSVYVLSNGVPLGAYDPASAVLEAWTRQLGLELVRIAATGHSYPEDIARMVELVRPGVVLPVHSRAPEALEVAGVRRLIPQPGRPYSTPELVR